MTTRLPTRPTRRRTVLLALACLGVAGLAGGTSASADVEAGSGFSSFRLLANAPGFDTGPAVMGQEGTVPEVATSLKTGPIGAALAAVAWPGPIGGNAGTTILVAAPTAPSQVAVLDDPDRAQTSTGGTRSATNDSVPGTHLASSSQPDHVSADASVAGTTSPIGSTGSITGHTDLVLKGATSATTTAASKVADLSLAGGVIHIGSVESNAVASSDGQKATSSGSTTVSGMTIAGVPVTVDDTGLHVMGQGAANPVPLDTVNSAIAASGLVVLVTPPRSTVEAGSASYDAGALVIGYTAMGDTNYVTLGRASASVAAVRAQAVVPPTAVALPPATAPVLTTGSTISSGFAGTPDIPGTPGSPGSLSPTTTSATPDAAVPPIAAPFDNAAATAPLGLSKGVPFALVVLALLASGGVAAAVRRLPDRVLEREGVVCNLEQS